MTNLIAPAKACDTFVNNTVLLEWLVLSLRAQIPAVEVP